MGGHDASYWCVVELLVLANFDTGVPCGTLHPVFLSLSLYFILFFSRRLFVYSSCQGSIYAVRELSGVAGLCKEGLRSMLLSHSLSTVTVIDTLPRAFSDGRGSFE